MVVFARPDRESVSDGERESERERERGREKEASFFDGKLRRNLDERTELSISHRPLARET